MPAQPQEPVVASGPTVAVLGASGLIGEAICRGLMREGIRIVAVARHFTASQRAAFGGTAVEIAVADLDAAALSSFLPSLNAGIVINCLGVLQDSGRGSTQGVHVAFVQRLLSALAAEPRAAALIHLSIPGTAETDVTAFSQSKRTAEAAIAASPVPSVILRPGFVIAPAAYGGSGLIRALAALPLDLSSDARRPFAATAIGDLVGTITVLTRRWQAGERDWKQTFDVMEQHPSTAGDVVAAFRRHLGGPKPVLRLPAWTIRIGSRLADMSAHLGWMPPIRGTAVEELRRGVTGDPQPWMAATGITPKTLGQAMAETGASIQEKWFARLYLLKALIIGALVVFWIVSGAIALASFTAASTILSTHGFSARTADVLTVVSSLADIGIGLAIAFRRTCRWGLNAGIGLSLFYMTSAAVLTPELWFEPLGALVKTAPAIVLMLVALAILDDR